MRTRAYAWFDSRQQTEYGTLRTYLQLGVNYDSPQVPARPSTRTGPSSSSPASPSVPRSRSSTSIRLRRASYWGALASDTGDGGWKVFAYTLQFGNGISTTFSIEEPRSFGMANPDSGVLNTNFGNAGLVLGTPVALDPDRAKERFPDIVENWRIDQAWGSAQIMGAVHDVSAGYYANTVGVGDRPLRDRYRWYPRGTAAGDHRFGGLRSSCRQAGLGCGHRFQVQPLPVTTSSSRSPTPKAPPAT